MQSTACVDGMTRTSELAKTLDVLRYVVVAIAVAGIAIALFG